MWQKVSSSLRQERDLVDALAQQLPEGRKLKQEFTTLWLGNSFFTFETSRL
jgi:hypothetical protein